MQQTQEKKKAGRREKQVGTQTRSKRVSEQNRKGLAKIPMSDDVTELLDPAVPEVNTKLLSYTSQYILFLN